MHPSQLVYIDLNASLICETNVLIIQFRGWGENIIYKYQQ